MAKQLTRYEEIVAEGRTLHDGAVRALYARRKVREQDIERIDRCLNRHAENKKGAGSGEVKEKVYKQEGASESDVVLSQQRADT